MNIKCDICSSSVSLVGETRDLSGSDTHIYYCEHCDVQFALSKNTAGVYDMLYSSGSFGYHHEKKIDHNSLQELISKDPAFCVISSCLPTSPANILEVGCGYGSLVNALNKLGHQTYGIDIAEQPINYAKKEYGNYFEKKEIIDIENSYDIIIAMEVIEHLFHPVDFIKKCAKLLNPGGKIILTTPNKDFYTKRALWVTNPPPIHLWWFGKRAMKIIAERSGLRLHIFSYEKCLLRNTTRNPLAEFIRYRGRKNNEGVFIKPTNEPGPARKALRALSSSVPALAIALSLSFFIPIPTRELAVVLTKV